ncbi:MAG: penicillin acylase family protein [Gemmatimonadota bacterium]|nr:penicillin acylase family protein [Gemmatimonadota bacterium]
MKKLPLLLAACALACAHESASNPDAPRWERQAANVTIVRDDWGIPHIHGKTDADAVFGMVYAQSEDDFKRVETNYINAMGRLAEAEGESAIYRDLRMKLFVDPDSLKAQYAASPEFLKTLMVAWADGLNFYMYKHPSVKARMITHFEPWMALSFTEGSIGGDIEKVSLPSLQAFYGDSSASRAFAMAEFHFAEPSGSNGFAIAPSNTADHHALLLINPHTSFYFRAELQMTSDEGLNAYGATTWGQFFVYQGFNPRVGWMHTTSGADVVDEYAETIVKKGDSLYYKYGAELRPVTAYAITVPYRTSGGMQQKKFTVFRTMHGPIVRADSGKWISIRLMQEPIKALTQSYTRTKATSYKSFRETMELHTNSSNNTIFADADGDIAYFHANHVPIRDTHFDWRKPVDGSNPATDYKGVTSIDSSPHLLNPPNGWLYNSNNWPYSAAGAYSPKKADYPAYMDQGIESPRGLHAIRVLSNRKDFTLQSLIEAAYDSYQPAFADLVPTLIDAYDKTPASDPVKAKVAAQIALLRPWDYRWSVQSVPTTLACYWGDELGRRVHADADGEDMSIYEYMAKKTSAHEKLDALAVASDSLTKNFGTWKMPWGAVNRFQRLTDDIVQPFDDARPSIPVGFASARWGSLASFGPWEKEKTKKLYGTGGNSFVAVVDFGPDSVHARAITAGGQSGDTASKHFDDQALRYSTGDLREVYFYPSQLVGHTERTYHPGS